MDATTVAVDVAKTVFEVAIANHEWHIVARHRFNRRQFTQFLATASPTHVVMEACGTAHFWGRCAQRYGHTVTLLPPAYVRPYVRRNKTDRTDAEALLEATCSGQIPSVPVKSVAQQTLVAVHRIPALTKRWRGRDTDVHGGPIAWPDVPPGPARNQAGKSAPGRRLGTVSRRAPEA